MIGERPAAPIARRPRIRAGRLGPHAKPRAIEATDRAAARRDRVNRHHRRAQPNARDHGFERALVLPGVVRHIRRRAAHVESDHLLEARACCRLRHADDAAGRARTGSRPCPETRWPPPSPPFDCMNDSRESDGPACRQRIDAPPKHRRDIGIDDGRVAAPHELHQPARLMTRRDAREADLARDLGEPLLVLRIAIAMHQHDRDRSNTGRRTPPETGRAHRASSSADAHVAVTPSRALRSRRRAHRACAGNTMCRSNRRGRF